MQNQFQSLDDRLKKVIGSYKMEIQTEKAIREFYEKNTKISSNDLTNRLYKVKAYDEKYKLFYLPIIITIVFSMAITFSQGLLTYQKAETIDYLANQWEESSRQVTVTEENKEAFDEVEVFY